MSTPISLTMVSMHRREPSIEPDSAMSMPLIACNISPSLWDVAGLCLAVWALLRSAGTWPIAFMAILIAVFVARSFIVLKGRRIGVPAPGLRGQSQIHALDLVGTATNSMLCCFCLLAGSDDLMRLLAVALVFGNSQALASRRVGALRGPPERSASTALSSPEGKAGPIDAPISAGVLNLAFYRLGLWLLPMIALGPWLGPYAWLLSAFAIVHFVTMGCIIRERRAESRKLEKVERDSLDVQRVLHERQSELRAVFDNAAAGVVEFDLVAGRLTRVNQVFCHLVGRSEQEILDGFDLSVLTFPEDRPAEVKRWATLRKTGKPFHVERRYLRPDRSVVWAHVSVAVFSTDAAGNPTRVVSILQDVTERRKAEARIAHLAYHDPLTDLLNRAAFRIHIDQALALAERGQPFALLCLDLDHFKGVNDTLGHPVGDALLRAVTERLRAVTRAGDVVARLGGDEFAIIQSNFDTGQDAAALAERLVIALEQPFDLEGHPVVIGTSVGIALAPDDGADHDLLLSHADMALYAAKIAGRGGYRFFERSMCVMVQTRRAMEADLRCALSDDAFELYYQPIVDIPTQALRGFEALLRWRHPTRGLIAPDQFIPLAEAIGLISSIGAWVMRCACAEAACWPADLRLAVNVSALQFVGGTLVEDTMSSLLASGLDPRRLELEITETAMLLQTETTVAILHRLKALGIAIAMDDFGTGYSSLNYLHRFAFDRVKIDKSFVAALGPTLESRAIVTAVTKMCSSLNIETTAEGVETEQQLAILTHIGCDEAQGYYFSRPKPKADIAEIILKFKDNLVSV